MYWNSDPKDNLPTTLNNNKHIVTATCMFSKWVEASAIPNRTSTTVAHWFWTNIICRYGIPKRVRVDNGNEFEKHFL